MHVHIFARSHLNAYNQIQLQEVFFKNNDANVIEKV